MTEKPPRSAVPTNRELRAQASSPTDLARVRLLVAEVAVPAGLDPDRTGGLVVAVNEIVANAITHGQPPATITMTATGANICVAVHDLGGGPDRDGLADAQLPGPQHLRGRGLWLATQLCDQVDVRSDADGTTVTLILGLRQR